MGTILEFMGVFLGFIIGYKKCWSIDFYKLCISIWLLLFSDAEVCEDVAEDFVGGDFAACDFGEMEEGFADVLGYEVGWDIGL